jgi:hypothetical protein
MNQLGINPFMDMEYERRHEELIKQAAQYHLVENALKADSLKMRGTSKFLALVGKELASLGSSLEKRYSGQPETNVALNQQSNPRGCS